MLVGGIVLGLIAGLLLGGSFGNLVSVRLRWPAAIFLAVIVRFGTEAALVRGVEAADVLRLPLLAGAYGILLVGLWVNRHHSGLGLTFVGTLANAIPIVANGGYMPIWAPSLATAGFAPSDVGSLLHVLLPAPLDGSFLLHAGPLADLIPVPLPVVRNVASVGDLFITAGLAFFLFATLIRRQDEVDATDALAGEYGLAGLTGLAGTTRLPRSLESVVGAHSGIRAETGLAPGLAEASALDRPLVLAGAGTGLAAPALATLPRELEPIAAGATAVAGGTIAVPYPIPGFAERARRHPYLRLALNGAFSALWIGQLISLFGDRVHQVALAFLVLRVTNSPIAVGLVFVAATLPNLILGPIAGTFVDRWDQRETMIVSDLLRAAAVLLVPIAAAVNVYLAYPLVFAITSISIFFRPAKTAVLPRIVRGDELLTANSATWIGETLADIGGYPLAGLFVAFLGTALPLAFWFDAATYVASAVLIASIAVPPVVRAAAGRGEGTDAGGNRGTVFAGELLAGWRFLRRETVLLANTLQGVAGQFTTGVALAVTPVYARDAIAGSGFDASTTYAFLETGIGVGNLIGGFVVGLIGARLAKGRMVIAGYTVYGLCVIGLALTGSLPAALGLMLGSGVANMVYVIPSQTLFQERTPPQMIGRVVGFRFALVFGAMTLAMGVAGVLAATIGAAAVLAIFGAVTLLAGLSGLLVPAVRNA